MSILIFVGLLLWILYRLWQSVLEWDDRKAIAKFRFIGLFSALAIGLLVELLIGRVTLSLHWKFDLISVPIIWLAIFGAAEWFGERELRARGKKTVGVFSRKLY